LVRPRVPHIDFPSVIDHATSRGNGGAAIFQILFSAKSQTGRSRIFASRSFTS